MRLYLPLAELTIYALYIMASLDNVLKKNTADLNKELEVERVIRAFKLK